jgi:hypothetical protein
MDKRANFMESVTVYDNVETDTLLTGPVSHILNLDTSAFDVGGRHWVYVNGKKEVHALPSKASLRIGNNNNYRSSRVGVDLLRNAFQTNIDIVSKKLEMANTISKITLNGPMFNKKTDLASLDNLALTIFEELTEQSDPGITSGLSGFRYEIKPKGGVSDIRSDLTTIRTYWDKFTSSQNSKKAVFELINERVIDRLNSPSEYNLEAFVSKAREIRQDDILMKDAQEILRDKYGYGRNVDFLSIFDDVIENAQNYYGAIYDNHGERTYGIVLRGVVGTYIKTEETFDRGGSGILIFRILENEDGDRSIEHSTKVLQYEIRDGVKVLELRLNEEELKSGWRIGACKRYGESFKYFEQAIIALDGKKIFGRFDFDFEKNKLVDRLELWYEDKSMWQYEKINGLKVGIQILNPLSITYGGISTIIYSQTDISSQYLKHGIEYEWAEAYFEDPSWIRTRSKSEEIERNILIKGIDKARELFSPDELFEAYLYLCDYRYVFGLASASNVRPQLNKLLGKLNLKQDPLTGQIFHGDIDESLGRTELEVKSILDTILKSQDDIRTFFIEERDGSVDKALTFKQWLNFMVNSIKNGDPSKCKDSGAKQVLVWAKAELNKIGDLKMSENKFFDDEGSNSELVRGKNLFEIVLDVIGHSTFRYLATHGIAHNQEVGSIAIGIMNIRGADPLAESCNQFAFYPSTMATKGEGAFKVGGAGISTHKFSLFFGDSVVYFAAKDNIRSSKNAYYLGNVPLSYLESGHTVSSEVYSDLQFDFLKMYEQYKASRYSSLEQNRVKSFLSSDAFEVIQGYINTITESMYKSKAEQYYRARRAELHLRIGLQNNKNPIRITLEHALMDLDSNFNLDLGVLKVTGIATSSFKNTRIIGAWDFGISSETQHISNKKAIDNRAEIFRDAIRDNAELGGKARFFLTVEGEEGGAKYLKIYDQDPLSEYFVPHGGKISSEAIYMDIDINNDPNHDLEFLARLSLTYRQAQNDYRFGLIMKQQGSSIGDSAYFALAGDTFLASGEVYSDGIEKRTGYRLYVPITDLRFTGKFNTGHYNSKIDKHYFIYDYISR